MSRNFEPFDFAFAPAPAAGASAAPLRRRKTIRQWLSHLLANAVVLPVVAVIYITTSSEGLRLSLPLLQRRLYSLPIPGASLLRAYDGWNKLDLSVIVAGIMALAVAWCWAKFLKEVSGQGTLLKQGKSSPIVLILVSSCGACFVLGDAAIFAVGLAAQTEQGWADAPWYVVPLATLLFSFGIFAIAYWKHDFETSSHV